MSPESTHKLMGFYMEVLILGVILQYVVSASFKLFPIGCIGLNHTDHIRQVSPYYRPDKLE